LPFARGAAGLGCSTAPQAVPEAIQEQVERGDHLHPVVEQPLHLQTVDDPRVLADLPEHADGRRFAIAVSQADEALTAAVRVSDAATAGEAAETITLAPYGVAVVQLGQQR
jgi:hypothetical protein